jgi:hypothetical protein
VDAWLGLIGALAGVVVGALSEALRSKSTFWRERRWEARQERRKRLEEAFEAIGEIRQATTKLTGNVGVALLHSLKEVDLSTPPVPYTRMSMLASLYLPELAAEVQGLLKARDAFMLVLYHCLEQRTASKDSRDKALERLKVASLAVDSQCDTVLASLSSLARTHEWMLKAGEP